MGAHNSSKLKKLEVSVVQKKCLNRPVIVPTLDLKLSSRVKV